MKSGSPVTERSLLNRGKDVGVDEMHGAFLGVAKVMGGLKT